MSLGNLKDWGFFLAARKAAGFPAGEISAPSKEGINVLVQLLLVHPCVYTSVQLRYMGLKAAHRAVFWKLRKKKGIPLNIHHQQCQEAELLAWGHKGFGHVCPHPLG